VLIIHFLDLLKSLKNMDLPCQKSERKLSSTLASLFSIVPNCKILLFLLPIVNDNFFILYIYIYIYIMSHLAAEPAQVLEVVHFSTIMLSAI
jgi:hypothetical protein